MSKIHQEPIPGVLKKTSDNTSDVLLSCLTGRLQEIFQLYQ